MSYNIAEYIIGWHFNGDKLIDLSPTIFMRSTNESFKRTNTHTDTPTNAIGEIAMRCFSLKN